MSKTPARLTETRAFRAFALRHKHYLYADVAQQVAPGGTGKTTLDLLQIGAGAVVR